MRVQTQSIVITPQRQITTSSYQCEPAENIVRQGKDSFKIEHVNQYVSDIKNITFDSLQELNEKLIKTMTMFHLQNSPKEKARYDNKEFTQMYIIKESKYLMVKCAMQHNK